MQSTVNKFYEEEDIDIRDDCMMDKYRNKYYNQKDYANNIFCKPNRYNRLFGNNKKKNINIANY